MCIRFTGFQDRVIFFYIKKYIEFNTVANLIRLHSYSRRVSRMTDELVMLAEWQNEYGSDYLILMRGRGRGREDVFGSAVVSSATRFCLSSRLLYNMCYIVYPCLGYFFPGKIGSWIFFSPKIFTSTPIKIKWSLTKRNTEKVSDW